MWEVLSEERVGKYLHFVCMCQCGKIKTVRADDIKSGKSKRCKSCAAKTRKNLNNRKTHGLSNTPEYGIWAGMIRRCTDEKYIGYKNYGGRGIAVCDSWQSFENFFADMGKRPSPKHSIDRIDNHDGYNPSNCRWALPWEQSVNRRKAKDKTSKYIGVSYHKGKKKWSADCAVGGKRVRLGYFATEKDASDAYEQYKQIAIAETHELWGWQCPVCGDSDCQQDIHCRSGDGF